MDPKLNELLKWSVENSAVTTKDPSSPPPPQRTLDPEVLAAILGGPSDADLMCESMAAVQSTDPSITLEDKLVAFDNFEQLIENLDNANNIGPLALWTPLLSCLDNEEKDIRKFAAWCIGTAVQNNQPSQERLLAMGGIERLVKLATSEKEGKEVRKKAVYALSSGCRNYQPGMDVLTVELGKISGREEQGKKIDAADMEACDVVIGALREEALAAAP